MPDPAATPDLPPDAPVLGVTSAAFGGKDHRVFAARMRAAAAEHGFRLEIQVHNTATEEELGELAALGCPLSFHAPLPGGHLINLAADEDVAWRRSLDLTLAAMARLGVRLAVFHGFVMTDRPIPAFGRGGLSYDEALGVGLRPELCLPGSRNCRDFSGTEECALRLERVRRRLAELRRELPGVTLAIENDFPAWGSALWFAEQVARLEHPVCLDLGHLWAVAHIFGRDFHAEVAAFLATGRVATMHFHASRHKPDTPAARFGDGHLPLSAPNAMDLPAVAAACRAAGLRHVVLEIPMATERDVHAFAAMWDGGR